MNYLLEKQRPTVLGAEHPYAWIFKLSQKIHKVTNESRTD